MSGMAEEPNDKNVRPGVLDFVSGAKRTTVSDCLSNIYSTHRSSVTELSLVSIGKAIIAHVCSPCGVSHLNEEN